MSAGDSLNPQQFLYHVAPVTARSSIAKHGIDWRKGVGANDEIPPDENPQGNYFHTSLEDGETSGKIAKQDLYRVAAHGLKTNADRMLGKDVAVYSTDPIPPSRVELLHSYEHYKYKRP